MDFISFLDQRKTLTDTGDLNGLNALEEKVTKIVADFLNGTFVAEMQTVPLFYSFFKTFAETNNLELKNLCDQALIKIQPLLDEFDREHNLTHLDELNTGTIEYNLNQLSAFDRLNPFEKESANQLKFQTFNDLLRLTDQIEIKGTDESAHENFIETLVKASKLQTFISLSLSPEKITQDLYLTTLRSNMENNLVLMLTADRIDSGMPINDKKVARLRIEYQKLLNALNKGQK